MTHRPPPRKKHAVTAIPGITLNNGVTIPQLGYGVFKISPGETVDTVRRALHSGYRHIDTAELYHNEKEVGQGVRESGIPREEVFVTSKLDNDSHDHQAALDAFQRSLDDLGFDYLDLFLIHWPTPDRGDYVQTWRAMEEIYRSGRAKAIGVSNFQPHHIQKLLDQTEIVPVVNQIELHPYFTQETVRAFNAEHGIATEAWSPIAQGRVLHDPAVQAIAERAGRTTAQVALRWHIQRGNIVFPKSVSTERMTQNLNLFDFSLTEEDMATISALNRDERIGPDPDTLNSF